ncbi:hypothetical protein [Asticcacaulis solisilvae]|uniref:hypothetical protein n=1 Tax=Asticcacaulis solisilvae TaxID=1217274 RepID=UPI003FD7C8FE
MYRRVLVIAVSLAFAGAAIAAPRDKPPVPVKLSPGGCWKYSGTADAFALTARAGDRLVITAAGEADFMGGGVSWATVQARDITVARKDKPDVVVLPEYGDGAYQFHKGGDYSITLWPHAIHGLPGMVIVCRAGPNTAK